MQAKIVKLGASNASTGAPVVEAFDPFGVDDDADNEPLGETNVFQALGLSTLPYPADKDGAAEGVLLEHIGGMNAALIGARDTRGTEIQKSLKPGDTVLHTTHPKSKAQLQLKGEKNQVALCLIDDKGATMMHQLDGKNFQVMLTAFGMLLQFKKGEGITLTDGTAAVMIRNGVIYHVGSSVLGGLTPIAPVHSGIGIGSTSIPTPGVFVGK